MRRAGLLAALALAGCTAAPAPVVTKIVTVPPHVPAALLTLPPPVPVPHVPATNAQVGTFIVNLRVDDQGLRDQITALHTILSTPKGKH